MWARLQGAKVTSHRVAGFGLEFVFWGFFPRPLCCIFQMQSASQGSGWSIMGRRIEVPTKVFCLTVNQNTRGARISSSCQSGKRDYVYSCDVQTELFCAQISITHVLSRPLRPIVTPHWSWYLGVMKGGVSGEDMPSCSSLADTHMGPISGALCWVSHRAQSFWLLIAKNSVSRL